MVRAQAAARANWAYRPERARCRRFFGVCSVDFPRQVFVDACDWDRGARFDCGLRRAANAVLWFRAVGDARW